MTSLSIDPAASLPIQPPRKTVRDDDGPSRDNFSAMVDDSAPRPAESARTDAGDKTDRPQASDDRRDAPVKAESDAPAPDKDTPVTDTAPATTAATSDTATQEAVQADTAKTDTPAPDIAAADAPAVPTSAIATTQIVPQTPVVPIAATAPAPVAEAGPLSIAAAALATTAATIEAATPQKAAADLATPAAGAEPMLIASVATKPVAKSPIQTSDATADATAPKPTATSETTPAPPAATPDGAPAESIAATTPHERHAAAAQPGAADASPQTFTPPQPAAPTATTIATAAPHVSVVASQTAPVPLNGLAMQIAATAISGKTSFDIRLDPAELGRIDVRLDVDRHGNVTSHLTVEKPETLAMLRQDAPQLQRALTDAGLQTSDKSLQFSLGDQSLSGQNNNPNANGGDDRRAMQRLVIATDDNVSIASAGRSYGRMPTSASGVDIRI